MDLNIASKILALLGVAVSLFNETGRQQGTPRRPRRYVDKAGMPHGGSGDKLRRKAMTGTVGVRNRGPYAAWHLVPKSVNRPHHRS